MKIITGKLKNRNIYMPKDIRPTSNLVRKAIFDTLGQDWEGLSMLELFAGSGAVGIEAISNNAKMVTFVEKDPKAFLVIRENLRIMEVDPRKYEILEVDAFASIKEFALDKKKFDIIFADPPFGRELAKKTLKQVGGYDILHPNSLLIIQHERKEKLPENEGNLSLVKEKQYGLNIISIYKDIKNV